jgi:hypothetical protein
MSVPPRAGTSGGEDAVATWLGLAVAVAALLVSALTAYVAYRHRREDVRTARVTAYFHWNAVFAKVSLGEGQEPVQVGYNLVVWNQGPASALRVGLVIMDTDGRVVDLAGVDDDEFPLDRLDGGGRYPVQFAARDKRYRGVRRYRAKLTWTDGNGQHEHVVPLRKGQTSM